VPTLLWPIGFGSRYGTELRAVDSLWLKDVRQRVRPLCSLDKKKERRRPYECTGVVYYTLLAGAVSWNCAIFFFGRRGESTLLDTAACMHAARKFRHQIYTSHITFVTRTNERPWCHGTEMRTLFPISQTCVCRTPTRPHGRQPRHVNLILRHETTRQEEGYVCVGSR
jgi:hypothetical protein